MWLLTTVLLAACSSREASSPDRAQLLPLEEPAMAGMEPAVREGLEARLRAVDRFSTPDTTNAVLGEAYGDLGNYLHAFELHRAAVPAYRNAELLLPRDVRWPYYLGHLHRTLGELDEGRSAFERALAVQPGDVPTLVALGQLAREQARLNDAEELARRALEVEPDSAGALLTLAQLAMDRGDDAAAAELYERLLILQPGATRLHQPLAMAYRSLGRTERAEQLLAQRGEGPVRIRDPLMQQVQALGAGARFHVTAGNTAFERGDFRTAADSYRSAVEAEPADAGAHMNLGSALFRLGDADGAIAAFRRALEIDPENAMAHFNLGVALARSGEEERAVGHYVEALRIDPDYRDPRFNLANALRRSGRCDEAVPHYSALIDRDPGNAPARLGEVLCLVEMRRWSAAIARLDASLEALPTHPVLANLTAQLLATCPEDHLRNGERALSIAERLVGLARSPEHLETMAMALAELGRYAEAAATQKEAIDLATAAGSGSIPDRMVRNLDAYRAGTPSRL